MTRAKESVTICETVYFQYFEPEKQDSMLRLLCGDQILHFDILAYIFKRFLKHLAQHQFQVIRIYCTNVTFMSQTQNEALLTHI